MSEKFIHNVLRYLVVASEYDYNELTINFAQTLIFLCLKN